MSTTLEDLDVRVKHLESAMEHLLAGRAPVIPGPMPPARQAELSRLFREALRTMNADVTGRPFVPPEEIRRRMVEHGVKPEECIATRAIRELHGEDEQ